MDGCEGPRQEFLEAQEKVTKLEPQLADARRELSEKKRVLQQCEGSNPVAVDPLTIFSMQLRCRTRSGTGSGNIIADMGDYYLGETNDHVFAGRKGSTALIDAFEGGDRVASIPCVIGDSWFKSGRSVDIAQFTIQKSDLPSGLKLPVVRYATAEDGIELGAGDALLVGACMEGLWPRPRLGNILRVQNGLVYYDPNAIGGDSGSPIVQYVKRLGEFLCVGRTAWSTRQPNGRWVGLAMDWRRIEQIKSGQVSDVDDKLPTEWRYPGDGDDDDRSFGM